MKKFFIALGLNFIVYACAQQNVVTLLTLERDAHYRWSNAAPGRLNQFIDPFEVTYKGFKRAHTPNTAGLHYTAESFFLTNVVEEDPATLIFLFDQQEMERSAASLATAIMRNVIRLELIALPRIRRVRFLLERIER